MFKFAYKIVEDAYDDGILTYSRKIADEFGLRRGIGSTDRVCPGSAA